MEYSEEERHIAMAEALLGGFGRKSRRIRRLLRRAVRAREAGTRDMATENSLVDAVNVWTVRQVMES